MHTVVLRRQLANDHPEVVKAIYQGFCTAKDAAAEHYTKGMMFNNMATMLPWFSKLVDADRSLLGNDWWPCGIDANRKAIDTILRYHHEQGLTKRRLTCEDIFARYLLDT
jgi:4,5-dihydroxyphthalate decarboxylase